MIETIPSRRFARHRGMLVSLLCAGLVACGGSGGGGSADEVSGEGEVADVGNVDEGDVETASEGSVLTEGEPPAVPTTTATARALAIDAAELDDALHFLATRLPAEIEAEDEACPGGGSRAFTAEGDARRAVFADCAPTASDSPRIDGTATLETEEDGSGVPARRLELDGLSVRSGPRSVTSSGALRLSTSGSALDVSLASDSLRVDDSQGELLVSELEATLPPSGEGGGEASVAYTLASTRAGETVAVSTDGTLAFDATLGCPSDGAIVLAFDDARVLRLLGAPGENLAMSGDFGEDTIGCAEIARLVPPATGFLPPPIPGN